MPLTMLLLMLALVVAGDLAPAPPPPPPPPAQSRGSSEAAKPDRKSATVAPLSQSEFERLPTKLMSPSALPRSWRQLAHLNRFSDINPTPHSRVRLQEVGGDPLTDYINANFVHNFGFSSPPYIATQGPLKETLVDFWRMVWEQDSAIIVMVTGLTEGGIQKCERYWPTGIGTQHEVHYGPFYIKMASNEKKSSYIQSELLVRRIESGQSGDVVRKIRHFWYDSWPDHGTPDQVTGILGMLDGVRTHRSADRHKPWIIHCSAGVGRAGTFIAIDMGMQQLIETGRADVLKLIQAMRKDRGGMVQTYPQADMVHRALVSIAENLNIQPARRLNRALASEL